MAKFNPIKTVRSKVDGITVTEGNFIFCTDTGEIFIDSSYGASSLKRRQGFPKHTRPPVDLIIEAGTQSGLDMMGDVNDPIQDKTIVFVKEVESYFYFDAASTATPDGETVVKPEYITTGPGRWHGFTTNGITPTIGANGNWFLGTVDTGKPSRGATPQIINKYWHIDGVNTNVKAEGKDGQDGVTPTVSINQTTKNWIINGIDTGIKAEGEDGEDGDQFEIVNKYWYINGVNTNVKAEGKDGTNGTTPHIDPSSKRWMIGSTDTGVVAQGVNGNHGTVVTIDPTTKNWKLDGVDSGVKSEGVDGIGLNFRGNFNASASPQYSKTGTVSDTVIHEGSMFAYIGASASNNAPPSAPETSNAYWVKIPMGTGGGGGSSMYLDPIASLEYSPGMKDAVYIGVEGHSDLSRIYILEDSSKTGKSRVWMHVDGDSGWRLAYESYSNCWVIESGYRYEYEGEVYWEWGMDPEGWVFSTSDGNDPFVLSYGQIDMIDTVPVDVSFTKFKDMPENDGLKSIGSSDDPIPHGAQCEVISEGAVFIFDAMMNTPEEPGVIIRPDYIGVLAPGRWVKHLLLNDPAYASVGTRMQVVSNKKYVDADVYLTFDNDDLTNYGIDTNVDIKPHYSNSINFKVVKNGKFKKAYLNRIKINSDTFAIRPGSNWTVSFWCFMLNNTRNNVKNNDIAIFVCGGCGVYIENNTAYMHKSYDDHSTRTTTPIPLGSDEWFHVAVVGKGNGIKLYINGISSNEEFPNFGLTGVSVGCWPYTTDSGSYDPISYVSDVAIWYNKSVYTSDFYPYDAPLYKQYYPVPVAQYVDSSIIDRLYKDDRLHEINLFKLLSNLDVKLNDGLTYKYFLSDNPGRAGNLIAEFTPNKTGSCLVHLLSSQGLGVATGNICPNLVNISGSFEDDNAMTDNKVNVYRVDYDGYNTSTITKVTTYDYSDLSMIMKFGSSFKNLDVNGISNLSSVDQDMTEGVSIANGKYVDAKINIHNYISTPVNASSYAIIDTSYCRHDGLIKLFTDTPYSAGWRKLFLVGNAGSGYSSSYYTLGIWNDCLVEITTAYGGSSGHIPHCRIVDTEHMWRDWAVMYESGDTVIKKAYGIDKNGHLYYFHSESGYDPETYEPVNINVPITLLDDTRNWNRFGDDGLIGLSEMPVALAEGKVYAIKTDDNTIIEVDSTTKNNTIDVWFQSQMGSSNYGMENVNNRFNGTYVKTSDTLYTKIGVNNAYLVYITDAEKTSSNNKWYFSIQSSGFTGMTDSQLRAVSPCRMNNWDGTSLNEFSVYYYIPANNTWDSSNKVSISVGNENWRTISGRFGSGSICALATKRDDTCFYLKWNADNTGIVSEPITITNTTHTNELWRLKRGVYNYIMKGTTLYKMTISSGVPTVSGATNDIIEDVTEYTRYFFSKEKLISNP